MKSLTMDDETYSAPAYSFTHRTEFQASVAKRHIGPEDSVLIVDDFLAIGSAALALADIVQQAGARLSGIGIVIEKGMQPGNNASSILGRNPSERELSGSIACDGFASMLSGFFGCTPITSFSQNVGLADMTKVINRFSIGTAAAIMIVAGISKPPCRRLTTKRNTGGSAPITKRPT